MEKDYGFGIISVEKELTNEEFLSKLYEADNKMQTNLLEGFEKLRQENKELKEQLAKKDKEIERLKYLLLDKENKSTFFEQLYNQTIEDAKIVKDCGSFTALNKIIRKQVCDEFKKAIITESIFDTEEEARCWTDDIDVKTILEIIDKLEQGEQQ